MFHKLLFCCLLFTCQFILNDSGEVSANIPQTQIPEYAPWGKLAVLETKKVYKNADVIDYLHVGKRVRNGVTTEVFKLWLREKSREFGVFFEVDFQTNTKKIINIRMQETKR